MPAMDLQRIGSHSRHSLLLLALIFAIWLAYIVQLRPHARDQLRQIVQQQCAPHWLAQHDPAPCRTIELTSVMRDGPGFALLHDRKGGAHFLLIPTMTVAGVESALAWGPGARNYYQDAWNQRDALTESVHREVPRSAIGMAMNSQSHRSQDQLHIHLSCLAPVVRDQLRSIAPGLGNTWGSIRIRGASYEILRLNSSDLVRENPLQLLAAHLPQPAQAMRGETVLVAGMDYAEGPGFALIAGAQVPGAESLLDPACQ